MPPLQLLSVPAQIAAHLRAELMRGHWKETMPGVGSLAKLLNVNHKSVEEALRQLEREGVLKGQGPGRKRAIISKVVRTERATRVTILPYEAKDRFALSIVELQHALSEAGHEVIIAEKSLVALGMNPARISRLVRRTQTDAWIIQAGSREVLEWFAAQPVPAIALFGRRDGIPIAAAGPGTHDACAHATRQLIALGHRRIVMLCRSERRKPDPGLTERTMLDELTAYGIPTSEYNLPDWDESIDGFQDLLSSLFRVSPPTALILGIGEFFLATQQFLAKRGLRVPEDVSLVCFDSDPSFDWCAPTVAHVRWEMEPVIRRLVQWVYNVRRGRIDRRQTVTPARFIAGGTVGPCSAR